MTVPSSLLQRYRQVWRREWRHRREMEPHVRRPYELQFLPPALALQDTPVHPAPRLLVLGITGFVLLSLLWASLGRIDVVAVAAGKVVPDGRSKLIQSRETAVVRAIHVTDGQRVTAGELLIELDPTAEQAGVSRLRSEHRSACTDRAIAGALLDVLSGAHPPSLADSSLCGADVKQKRQAGQQLQGQYQEYLSSLALLDASILQRQADIQVASREVSSLQQMLPFATRLSEDYRRLQTRHHVSQHAAMEKELARLDMQRQLSVRQAEVQQHTAGLEEAQRRRESVVTQTRRTLLDRREEAERKMAVLQQELEKARYAETLTRLTSPVTGTVQQLAVHSVGGVVTPAQRLMVIVPTDQPVEVEAVLENRDVGFVHAGQTVTVKVETFTYTRFGTVEGEVLSVSEDAVEDEKRGRVYTCRIRLLSDHLQVHGRPVALSPGMSVTAEIKTDRRRLISYFLSPLQQSLTESFRER